jgi:hypothetical protein
VIDNAYAKGLRFITDSDARNPGGAHIYAHLWDNGKTIVDELDRILAVRQKAIANFSVKNIRPNETYSHLEDVFVPLYFLHRYQTEATTKLRGQRWQRTRVRKCTGGLTTKSLEIGGSDIRRSYACNS